MKKYTKYLFVIVMIAQNNLTICMKKKRLRISSFKPTLQVKTSSNQKITNFKKNGDILELIYKNNKAIRDLTYDRSYSNVCDYELVGNKNFLFIVYGTLEYTGYLDELSFATSLIDRSNGEEHNYIKACSSINKRFLKFSGYYDYEALFDLKNNIMYKDIKSYSFYKNNSLLELKNNNHKTTLINLKTDKTYEEISGYNKEFDHEDLFIVNYPTRTQLIKTENDKVVREFENISYAYNFEKAKHLLFVKYKNNYAELVNVETNEVIKRFEHIKKIGSNRKNYVFIEYTDKPSEIIDVEATKTITLENINHVTWADYYKDYLWVKYKDSTAKLISFEGVMKAKTFCVEKASFVKDEARDYKFLWIKTISETHKQHNYKLINLENFQTILELTSDTELRLKKVITKNIPAELGDFWKLVFENHIHKIFDPKTHNILFTLEDKSTYARKDFSADAVTVCEDKTLLLTKNSPQKLIDTTNGEVVMDFDKNEQVTFGENEELLVRKENNPAQIYDLSSIKAAIKAN